MPPGPSATAPITIGAAEFRRSFASRLSRGELGPLAGRPLLVIELDDDPNLEALTRSLPCVVVGLAPSDLPLGGPTAGDVLLSELSSPPRPWTGDADAWIARLDAACAAAPMASCALAQLLRFSHGLSVADALIAESATYGMLQAGPEHARWLSEQPPSLQTVDNAPAVVTKRTGSLLSIRLHRPARHNAYSAAMRDGLVAALQIADADDTIGRIELTGDGPSFCSGGELAEFGTTPDPSTAHAVRVAAGAAAWMDRCGPRTVVRLHGSCIGAGLELATFAHVVEASNDMRCSLPEVRMGLIPGAGGTVSIPRRIGRHRTALLAISGTTVDAGTALDWGLVDRLEPADPSRPASDPAGRR